MSHRGDETLPVFVDEVEVSPGVTALGGEQVPRYGDREKKDGARWEVKRPQAPPLVENEQPQEHDGASDKEADEALGQGGQGGAGIEPVEQPAAAGARWLVHAEDEAEKRGAHQHRHGHV